MIEQVKCIGDEEQANKYLEECYRKLDVIGKTGESSTGMVIGIIFFPLLIALVMLFGWYLAK